MGRPRKNPVVTKFQKVEKTPSARKREQDKKQKVGERSHPSWFPTMRVPVEKPDRPNQHECRHLLKDRTLLMKSAAVDGEKYKLEVCEACKEILRNGEPHPDRLFRDPEPVEDDEGDDDEDED